MDSGVLLGCRQHFRCKSPDQRQQRTNHSHILHLHSYTENVSTVYTATNLKSQTRLGIVCRGNVQSSAKVLLQVFPGTSREPLYTYLSIQNTAIICLPFNIPSYSYDIISTIQPSLASKILRIPYAPIQCIFRSPPYLPRSSHRAHYLHPPAHRQSRSRP